jgi:predicted transcriptional regulator
MAVATVKSTYSLDVETVNALDRLAKRLNVSRSEALRRAIRQAAEQLPDPRQEALAAWESVQKLMALTPAEADRWVKEVRAERRASSLRMERAWR